MEFIPLGTSDARVSRLAYGCMRIAGDGSPGDRRKGKAAVRAALDEGYTLFDHADIYGGGASEEIFGEVLRETPGARERIFVTGKCGVRFADAEGPNRYDLSKEHILRSVDGSLARLGTDRLDLFLLHRPDPLFDPEEVSAAFRALEESGKVLRFGVSNFSPSQVSLLAEYSPVPLLVNQVEINIHRIDALFDGTLDQCRERRMTPQAWCPLGGVAYPAWENTFSPEDEARIAAESRRQAEAYGVDGWIVVLAWLLKHPSGIVPIVGSTRPERIGVAKRALDLPYSREDWYRLLEARNGKPVP
jgi:predicted oxidoreductase